MSSCLLKKAKKLLNYKINILLFEVSMSVTLSTGPGLVQQARTSVCKAANYIKTYPGKTAFAVAVLSVSLAALKLYCEFSSTGSNSNSLFKFNPLNCSVILCEGSVCQDIHPCSPLVTSSLFHSLFLPPQCLPCVG